MGATNKCETWQVLSNHCPIKLGLLNFLPSRCIMYLLDNRRERSNSCGEYLNCDNCYCQICGLFLGDEDLLTGESLAKRKEKSNQDGREKGAHKGVQKYHNRDSNGF